jgi:hypothetical protein
MRRAFLLLGATLVLAVLLTAAISLRTQPTPASPPSASSASSGKDAPSNRQPPFRRQYPDRDQLTPINQDSASDLQDRMGRATAVKTLAQAGWTQPALGRVADLNADWLETLARDDPDAFSEQLRCLKRLGNRPRVMDFLKTFPETAGLLATADDSEDLVEILDTDDAKHTLLMSLFVRHVGRRDVAALAAGLKENRDLVCRLIQRGLVGAEVLFVFPRTGLGASEYEKWLQDNLTTRLAGSDEDLASFVQFALMQGQDLHDQLNKEEAFRKQFRSGLWPKLLRVVNRKDEALEFYMDAPDLWPLLALEQGEPLLERRGLLASALLFGPDAYAKEFQDRVIKILLSGDGVTFQALTEGKFRKETLFRKLLERPVSGPVLAAALNKLFQQGANYRPLLEKYNKLTDEVLAEEVGPPPEGFQTWLPFYTHYMIARKLWQGRDPTTEEWVDAGIDTAIDVASFLFPPAKGGKAVTQTVKNVGTKAARKELAHETVELGIKAARKKLSKEAVEQLAKAGMERQARKWAVTHVFTEMQRSYRSMIKVIEKATSFEITDPVRFFYKHSNLGRESYKRLTELEARVFMRGDAKVFIHVDRLACDQAKRYLNSWLRDTAKEVVTDAVEDRNWRRHISAWWLLNTGDQVRVPAK